MEAVRGVFETPISRAREATPPAQERRPPMSQATKFGGWNPSA